MAIIIKRLAPNILRTAVTLAMLWAIAIAAPAGAQAPEWVVDEAGGDVGFYYRLEIAPQTVTGDEAVHTFDCTVFCRTSPDIGNLRLRVFNASGKQLHEGTIPLELDPGKNYAKFRWDTAGLGFEVYRLRFDILFDDPRVRSPWLDFTAYKRSESHTSAQLEAFSGHVDKLRDHLSELGAENYEPAYGTMRLALAEHTLDLARTAFDNGDWRGAGELVAYGTGLINRVRTQLTFFAQEPELYHPPRRPDLTKLQTARDGFHAENQHVYLFGLTGGEELAEDIAMLPKLGLNQATFFVDPSEEDFASHLPGHIMAARENNVSITVQVAQPGGTESGLTASVNIPEDLPIGADGKPYRDRLVALAGLLADEPIVNGLSILQRPNFDFRSESVRREFIRYLSGKYADRDELNRAWRSRVRDMSEIQLAADERPRPPFVYDWSDFHLSVVDTYLHGYAGAIAERGGPVRLQVTMGDGILQPGPARYEVDVETLGGTFGMIGVAPTAAHDSRFALNHPKSSMLYALADAFSDGAPVIGSALSLIDGKEARNPVGYARSAVWEAVMSGADGASAWAWETCAADSIASYPMLLEGYCAGAIDVNRLASIVHQFQTARAPVAIVWSRSSRIFQDGDPFIDSFVKAYEGASFGGQRVRIVSEQECIEGALEDVDVLVLPRATAMREEAFNAINAYIEGGGTIVRTGTPIPYTEHGHSRADVITSTVNTLLVRGVEAADGYMHGIESAYSRGALAQVPRAVNEHGYLLEGVRSRFIEYDGQRYLYLLNLRSEPVFCHLAGGAQHGRDLVEGQEVDFPLDLSPLRPMVIALESGDADIQSVTVGGSVTATE